jgi:uncharacterized protein YecE (DUF72 family)
VIRIGTAGWSYPDWEGVVYPAGAGARFDPLRYLAGFVDCIEINNSFYRIPAPTHASSWVRRVSEQDGFLFTVKLWRGFTHQAPGLSPADARKAAREFRDFLTPLHEAGRLGAVLIQFPYSFHATTENGERLRELLERLEAYPLAVEFRHASWLREELLDLLRQRGVAFCNIDQPEISANIPATAHCTSEIGYVRLHGRSASAWFDEGAGRDKRYDYLYGAEELAGWVDRISILAAGTRDVFIIANNHYRGKGLVNALELKSMIENEEVRAPGVLMEAYPRLSERARRGDPRRQAARSRQGALPFS